jgi:hypothetical protein
MFSGAHRTTLKDFAGSSVKIALTTCFVFILA